MIRTRMQGDTPFFPNMLNNGNVEVCLKEDVDKDLAEKDAEIAELKAALEDVKATAYAESVDAGMSERRLKRALYKACTMWAMREEQIANMAAYEASEYLPSKEDGFRRLAERWNKMNDKCRAMADKWR